VRPVEPQAPVRVLPPALVENQWKPGQSGSLPEQRRKGRGLAKRIRDVIGDDPQEIIGVLHDIALDPRAKNTDRILAARELLDRAYGKAPSHAPIEGGDPLEMNELDRAIVDIATRLRAAHPFEPAEVMRPQLVPPTDG
jgi:hypothetical protein